MYRAAPHPTPRLIQVSSLIADGATDKQIARELGLSTDGARIHVQRLLAITGSANRTQAAVRAVVDGMIPAAGDRVVVSVQHLQTLMAALRQAETQCRGLAGVAERFEAAYPAVSATPSGPDATVEGKPRRRTRTPSSHASSHTEGRP